jgi:hypothetical protein
MATFDGFGLARWLVADGRAYLHLPTGQQITGAKLRNTVQARKQVRRHTGSSSNLSLIAVVLSLSCLEIGGYLRASCKVVWRCFLGLSKHFVFQLLISLAAPNDVIYQPYRTSGKEDIDTKKQEVQPECCVPCGLTKCLRVCSSTSRVDF